MKTTIAIILGVCVAIGLVLCCATEEHTFGNCQTFETRSRKTMAWNSSDFPDLPRKDGWMRICVTHPFLGILDRGRCSGYGEANAFRSALVSATGNAELSMSATLCLANGKRIDIPIPRPLSWGPEK